MSIKARIDFESYGGYGTYVHYGSPQGLGVELCRIIRRDGNVNQLIDILNANDGWWLSLNANENTEPAEYVKSRFNNAAAVSGYGVFIPQDNYAATEAVDYIYFIHNNGDIDIINEWEGKTIATINAYDNNSGTQMNNTEF